MACVNQLEAMLVLSSSNQQQQQSRFANTVNASSKTIFGIEDGEQTIQIAKFYILGKVWSK